MVLEKIGNQYELFSHETHRHLGTFNNKSDAERREEQINYFKNKGQETGGAIDVQNPNSEKAALGNKVIESFCKKNNLPYSLCYLSQLASNKNKYCFVFTGNEKDNFNNGYTHHWDVTAGNYIFDSYGYAHKYSLPERMKPIKLHPSRIQEFNSDVCGEYCCRFLWYMIRENPDFENLGYDFCNVAGFTSNQKENDKKVLEWYNEHN